MSNPDQPQTHRLLLSELLHADPDAHALVEQFVLSLNHRSGELRRAYEQLDWDALATLAHQLKGAGGSYGYPDISRLAATMEAAFRAHGADQFATWMAQLQQLIAAAHLGLEQT